MSDGKIRKEYTCFVYVEREDGTKELTYVPASEWFRRLREDAGLKGDARRYYKTDSYVDDGVERVLVEEVSHEEYKPWNSAHTIYLNNFVNARDEFRFVSFSDPLPNSDSGLTYEDVIEDPNANTQEQGETNLAVEVFREKLRTKPEWMTDMMNLNQYGYEKDCDALMCRKHGVTDRTVRNYKAAYRQAAASFVKDWCNTDNSKH